MPNQYLPGVIQTPSSLLITAATNAYPIAITVAIGNPSADVVNYQPGMAVKMFVPPAYGMIQANGLQPTILAIDGDTFYLDVDSRLFDAFSVPVVSSIGPATIAPAGSRNVQYGNYTQFYVPFRSLNNIGN